MKLRATTRLKLRDVLVLHLSDLDDSEQDALNTFAQELSHSVRIPIIVLQEGMTLDSLSDEQMAKAGWVRVKNHQPQSPAPQPVLVERVEA